MSVTFLSTKLPSPFCLDICIPANISFDVEINVFIFKMWTKAELEDLGDTFRDIKLEDILDSEELDVIKENSSRYKNLVDGIIVPKHNKKVRNILLTKLIDISRSKPFSSNRSMVQCIWTLG